MYFLPAAQEITVGSTGWNTIDLTGAPFSVPATSPFAVIRVNIASGVKVLFRKTGSAYTGSVGQPSSGGVMDDAFAPLSSGGIDIYASTLTGLKVYLVGYVESAEGASFAEPIDITPTVPAVPAAHPLKDGTWRTLNVNAHVPSTAMWAVLQVVSVGHIMTFASPDDYNGYLQVRKTGTTIPANIISASPAGAGDFRRTHWVLAPVDTSGNIDIWGPLVSRVTYPGENRVCYLMGYLTIGTHNASPTTVGTGRITMVLSTSTWETETATQSAQAIVMAATMGTSAATGGAQQQYGWRKGGSTDAIYGISASSSADHESNIPCAIVPLDASNQWQGNRGYATSTTFNDILYHTLGWLDSVVGVDESATITDTLVQDLYTREQSESLSVSDALAVGDTYNPDAIVESATVSDAMVYDHAYGGITLETLEISDTFEAEKALLSTSGTLTIEAIFCTGDGSFGDIVSTSFDIPIEFSGTGLTGFVAEDSQDCLVDLPNATGLWGGYSDAQEIPVYFDLNATGASGSIGTNDNLDIALEFQTIGSLYAGFVGTNTALNVLVDIDGDGYLDNGIGTGTLDILLSIYGDYTASGIPMSEEFWSVIAMNIPTAAVSRYDRNYSSYCSDKNGSHAIVDGDIYGMGERTDNGTAISSSIAKSCIDMGTSKRKMSSDLYMRMMSEGNFTIDVSSDRGSGTVSITDGITRKHGCKANLPRGVSGREFGFNLKNVSGAYFEIDEFEFITEVSEGRRGRQTNG